MSKVTDKTKFFLAKGLRFRIGKEGNLYASISHSSGEFFVAPEVLSLLCLLEEKGELLKNSAIPFELKNKYTETLENIPSAAECKALIADLEAAGVLISTTPKSRNLQSDGFGDPWIQWAMLADKVRCNSYYEAIKSCISPNSVVLDVGAGTGFLSATALHLGAKKVIAIEETQIAETIKPLFSKVGLKVNDKNFQLQNVNSFDATIPNDVNLVVSELFGNDPFQEGILSTLRNIGERLKGKKVQYIPEKLTVYFEFIKLKSHKQLNRISRFKQKNDKTLKENFYENFLNSSFEIFSNEDISFPIELKNDEFERVSETIKLGNCALNPPRKNCSDLFSGEKSVKVLTENIDGVVGIMWFRAQLTKSVSISNHPLEDDSCEHWSPIAVPLKKNINIVSEIQISFCLNTSENFIQVHLGGFHGN